MRGNSNSSHGINNNNNNIGNKRPATLDLNPKAPSGKKLRLNQAVQPLVIESPDLQSFKLTTPDIERIVLNGFPTPTPNLTFPAKFATTTQGTTEQEDYVKGFVDALNSLHKKDSQNTMSTVATTTVNSVVTGNGMSGGSITYTNLDDSYPVAIKDEPQTVPNSPPLSPIDMETQERIKLERKRQRNRVAASKCRKRKLERISKLEDKVKILKGENGELSAIIKQLREDIFSLKRQVLEHHKAGCTIPIQETK
ncbi:unnamed protein product [Hermetia illucens]|uniref:BZIP domain-containing protein n=1 Tax=Hermetia illucens TaxID=343691 RepID=A0A7R8UBL8_HERIL|nr:transcription factor AP-1 isoform X2 [Hermetia illucens]CAD7077785.1 unnamed protein product [Hermetia illucens]